MPPVVRADIALEPAVMVCLEDIQDACVPVAVPVAGLGEIPVLEVLHIADMGKRDPVAVLADNAGHIVLRIRVQAAGTKGKAIIGIVHHPQELVNGRRVHQQPGQAEDIPWGIVHVDGHLDIALMAHRHQLLQEILQVLPKLLLGHRLVSLEQLIQFRHPLRLPPGERQAVQIVQNIIRHLLGVVMNLAGLVIQRRGAVPHRMEQIRPRPVEHRHEVIADHLHPEPGQIPYGLDIIGDIPVPAGQADLDVVMDIHRLHHVHVEPIGLQRFLYPRNLLHFPDLAGHFVMQRPHDAGHARNLLDVAQLDVVIAFAVPAKTHLHSHKMIPLLSFLFCATYCKRLHFLILIPSSNLCNHYIPNFQYTKFKLTCTPGPEECPITLGILPGK